MNIIITGSSKGIGLAIAHEAAKKGHNLVLCSRNESEISNIADALSKEHNINVYGWKVDMSIQSEVVAFGHRVIDTIGSVDVLINNAGVFYPGSILEESENALESMINTNLYSAYHLSRVIAPTMIAKKTGHIINMCSIASQIAYPNGGSYSISKFALLGFSKVLREELKEHNVKVTSILPGATWSHSWSGVDLPESRLMQATDIAKVVMTAINLGPSATLEEVVIRPQLGDL